MVAARVKGDTAAQGRIDELSEEINGLRREELQDYGAAAEFSQILDAERQALKQDEWKLRCAQVSELIAAREQGVLEDRMAALAEQLEKTVREYGTPTGKSPPRCSVCILRCIPKQGNWIIWNLQRRPLLFTCKLSEEVINTLPFVLADGSGGACGSEVLRELNKGSTRRRLRVSEELASRLRTSVKFLAARRV